MAESPTTASQYITNIECEILGDINNDENLNSLDVILLLGIIVNSLEYESKKNFLHFIEFLNARIDSGYFFSFCKRWCI